MTHERKGRKMGIPEVYVCAPSDSTGAASPNPYAALKRCLSASYTYRISDCGHYGRATLPSPECAVMQDCI